MKSKLLPLMLPLRSVIFILIFTVGAAVTGKELEDISTWWTPACTLVNLLTILLVVLYAKKNGQTYRELMNFKKGAASKKHTIIATVVIAWIGMAGMYMAGFVCYGSMMPEVSVKIAAPINVILAAVNLLLLPATVPFAEDGLYLGCGVNGIKNKYASVIVPTFFYALQHCFIPMLPDGKYIVYRFVSFLPAALLLCIYYKKTKNPVPVMIGHALLDAGTAVTIFITSVSPDLYDKWCSMV